MARRVGELSRDKGRLFSPHTWTNGIGFAINLHIAASFDHCPILEYPWEPDSWAPHARDAMLAKPFLAQDGFVDLPSGPGLGVELNPEAMVQFAKRI